MGVGELLKCFVLSFYYYRESSINDVTHLGGEGGPQLCDDGGRGWG